MDKTNEHVAQMEDELRNVKLQLQQSQAQLDLIFKQGKTEKERLQASLNNIFDGTLFHLVRDVRTGALCFDYVSSTWEKIMGVSAEESISDLQKVFVNFEPGDLIQLKQCIYDLPEPTVINIEMQYFHPVSKTQRWLHITSNPSLSDDYIYFDGYIFDITSKKEAEQNFDFEQKRLNALNNIPDGTLYRTVRDMKTGLLKFVHLWGQWEEIAGLSVEESLVDIRNVFKRIEPSDLTRLLYTIEESLNPLRSFEMEVRYFHPLKKDEYWLLISSHPHSEGDQIVADGFIFDITARKVAERKLKAEKERLQTIGDNIPAGSLYQFTRDKITRQMRMLYVSASWEDVSGITAEDALNDILKVFSNIPGDEYKNFLDAIDESERTMSDFRQETRMGDRWLQWFSRPRHENSTIIWDGIIMNITSSKMAEAKLMQYKNNLEKLVEERTEELSSTNDELSSTNEELAAVNEELIAVNEELTTVNNELDITNVELQKYQTDLENMVNERTKELVHAKDKAEESDRLKSAFLANMSHEIRTPLNGIVGFLQFLDSDKLSPTRRMGFVEVIKNSSTQLIKIIDDIIDVSKIEAKLLNINPTPVRINELMNEMHLFFETILHSKDKGHVELILDDNKFINDCVIYTDGVRLRQIFINLLGNAVKFTDKGYIYFGYCQSAPDMLEFLVEDSGIGLADDVKKDNIFEPFFQAKLGSHKFYGGTGLGLPISRSLVQLNGGDIWVKSKEGFGSQFFFTISYLPIAPEDEYIFSEEPDEKKSLVKPFVGKKVLLVESEPIKSLYYEKLILATGATVIKAESLEKWLKHLVQSDHIDLVIADGTLFDNENSYQIRRIINKRDNLPTALIVSEKKQSTAQNLCYTTIELPIGYAKILNVMDSALRSE